MEKKYKVGYTQGAYDMFHIDAIFIGSDWVGNPRWEKTKVELAKYGVDVVFLPYTDGVSSTLLRPQEGNAVEG